MILRGLLCTALLLALPALAQTDAAQSAGEPSPAVASDETKSDATTPDSTMSAMRIECTPASRASVLAGKHGCVAGKVFRVTTTKHGDVHLSLCPSHSGDACSFHVVAKRHDIGNVGNLSYLRGKIIAVVGDVAEYRDHPAIFVSDKEQIQVAAGDAPPEFGASQPRPVSKGIPGARDIPGVKDIPGVRPGRAW